MKGLLGVKLFKREYIRVYIQTLLIQSTILCLDWTRISRLHFSTPVEEFN
jgi:hypothetical protein